MTIKIAVLAAVAGGLLGQEPPHQQTPQTTPPSPAARPTPPAPQSRFATAFPQRPPGDPAAIERGKTLYGVNCTFCHGADARGGSSGPSLIRSQVVLNDQNGELITPIVQNGVADKMPKMTLANAQVSDIAAFLHSFRVSGYDASRQRPPSIVVGDAKAGEAYFNAKCGSCHSVTGDVQGFAARFTDPRAMQQAWLMPGASRRGPGGGGPSEGSNLPRTTVKVTLPSGQTFEGRLVRIDDFIVTLAEAAGGQRTFRRDGDVPKVEVNDPLKPHKDLLSVYADRDIHNVTAYLVSLNGQTQ